MQNLHGRNPPSRLRNTPFGHPTTGGNASQVQMGPVENQIVVYQPNETVRLDVRVENETVWLTQSQMATLFGCSTDNVGLHLKNNYSCGELDKEATTEESSVVQIEGRRKVSRKVCLYNLDAIISVGYRVNSILGVKFRQWATRVLKEYLLRGYSVNARMKNLSARESLDLTMPPSRLTSLRSAWRRDSAVVEKVRQRGVCELCGKRQTFEKTSGGQYFEAHHLIPIASQGLFGVSLDVLANTICLCPECHRFLHYGRSDERREALKKIYTNRADSLKAVQLVTTQAQFLRYTLDS